MSQQRGILITFEGGEGSGKSTQVRLLAQALVDKGCDVLCTREPGGTPGADAIRQLLVTGPSDKWDPWAEFLLVSAARQDHVRRVILPALETGKWVISDRYYDSSRVYQGIVGGVGLDVIDEVSLGTLGFPVPAITFLMDMPPGEGLHRAAQRLSGVSAPASKGLPCGNHGATTRESPEDRYESKGLSFHAAVRQGYLDLATADPDRFVVLDAQGEPDALAHEIFSVISKRFLGDAP